MKTFRLLRPPLASFMLAALVARFWPRAIGPVEAEKSDASALVFPTGKASRTNPGKSSGLAKVPEPPKGSVEVTSAAAPTMAEIFAAAGLDRLLLMARFIQTASGEELKAVIDRAEDDQIDESTFSDPIWLRWVEVDLEAALKQARSDKAWWAYAKLDPQAALARALETKPTALPSVIRSIAQSDPALAGKLLAEHPEVKQSSVMEGLLEGLGKIDLKAASALALAKGGSYLESQFTLWMRQDPEQALAWMRGLTKPAERRRVEAVAMAQIIATDPANGLKEARKLPPGIGQTTHTIEAIAALGRQDPAAARAAADAMPTPAARQKALAALAVSLASVGDAAVTRDLISSVDWKLLANSYQSDWSYTPAEGRGTSHGQSGYAADEPLYQLMTTAPQATADALAGLVASPDSSNGPADTWASVRLSQAVQKWANVQPEAASTWLKNQPPGAAQDEGIAGLTSWLTYSSGGSDYAAALAWAGEASSERQFKLYQQTVSVWKNKDPQAAAAAVETLPISDGQRNQLRQILSANPSPDADPFAK